VKVNDNMLRFVCGKRYNNVELVIEANLRHFFLFDLRLGFHSAVGSLGRVCTLLFFA